MAACGVSCSKLAKNQRAAWSAPESAWRWQARSPALVEDGVECGGIGHQFAHAGGDGAELFNRDFDQCRFKRRGLRPANCAATDYAVVSVSAA